MQISVGTIRLHWVLEDGSKFYGTYEEALAEQERNKD